MDDLSAGDICVVAGTGEAGESGDGGPAERAALFSPGALCLDEQGSLFIADQNSFSVRCVDVAEGTIRTVAGGMAEPPGDETGIGGFDACEQALPDGAPAVCAAIDAADLAACAGRLLLALPDEHRVRYVELDSGRLYTLAGTGEPGFTGDGGPAREARFQEPAGIALDADGNLFVADSENDRVRRVGAAGGLVETVAGGGTSDPCRDDEPPAALEARLMRPRRLAVLPDGDLVIGSDAGVFCLERATRRLRPLVADRSACDELSLSIDAVDCDDRGNLFFASSLSQAILMLAAGSQRLVRVVGSGCLGQCECLEAPTAVDLASPRGLVVGGDKRLYFSDAGVYRTFRVDLPRPCQAPTASDRGR
jgi:sugar lactone lactonase YvrE